MKKRQLSLILTLTLLSSAQVATAQADAALELARRLVSPWGDSGTRVEVTPGELPAALPVRVPLPSDFVVIGSFANYGPEGEFMHGQVILDSPADTQATHRTLDETFGAAGWTVNQQGQMQGFQPANPHVAGTYCAPDGMGHIYMNAFPLPEGGTDVRLELSGDVHFSPCSQSEAAPETPPVPLPTLTAPESSQTTIHGGNWVGDQASSSAIVATDFPADELLRHFEDQLERVGWVRNETAQQRSAWTRSHQEREWLGLLAIEELADSLYYVAYVVIASGE